MPVVAVVNRKGGSGKSTVAAHLAAWYAQQGKSVVLGDVDRQQSTRAWLRRRDACLPNITPWTIDKTNVLRVPTSMTHVVLDTPGGLQGLELARMVMFADAILMPVCSSAFDREATANCHAELMTLPRIASGRCRLACIGMRIDADTHAASTLADWAASLALPFLGVLRETDLYVQCLECGMTLFDLPPQKSTIDRPQWEPILGWLRPVMDPLSVAPTLVPSPILQSQRVKSSLTNSLLPAQETLVHGDRLNGVIEQRYAPARIQTCNTPAANYQTSISERQQMPSFLKPTF